MTIGFTGRAPCAKPVPRWRRPLRPSVGQPPAAPEASPLSPSSADFTGRINSPPSPRSNTFYGPPCSRPTRRHLSCGNTVCRFRVIVVAFIGNTLLWDQDVAGSNPVAPSTFFRAKAGIIEIRAAKAKTASRRTIPIVPNLKIWLRKYRKEGGLVCPFANLTEQLLDLTIAVNQARAKRAEGRGPEGNTSSGPWPPSPQRGEGGGGEVQVVA